MSTFEVSAQRASTELTDKLQALHTPAAITETELFERYYRSLVLVLSQRTKDRMLAEDLAQETLLIVIKRLRSRPLDEPSKLSGYVHQTARYLLIAHQRRVSNSKTDCVADVDQVTLDQQSDVDPTGEGQERKTATRAMIWDCLDDLSQERDKELLIRSYLYDESKTATCDALHLSTRHYDRVISRARHRLRKLVEVRQQSAVTA